MKNREPRTENEEWQESRSSVLGSPFSVPGSSFASPRGAKSPPPQPSPPNGGREQEGARGGFTLIETLVVIGIIAVLLAMTAPAIQKVRATVDTMRCASNLRQIGQALHAHHNDKQKFPPGGIEWRPPGNTTNRQIAWSAYLLPYLDADDVYRRLNLNTPFDSPQNATAAASVIKAYLCPTSRRDGPTVQGRGACDYGGIFGERITSPNNPPKGAMIYDIAFTRSDITDGLSTTLFISEDCGWVDGQWINGLNVFDVAYAINQAPPFENDPRSDHPGGVNGLFGDGCVRFLKNSMSLRPLAAICTRAGKEIVQASDF